MGFLAIVILRPGFLLPKSHLTIKRIWGVLLVSLLVAAASIAGLALWRATKTFLVVDWFPAWINPELHGAAFLLAALTNSVFEEHLWRGMMADLIRSGIFGPIFIAICFALTHYASLPNGAIGVAFTFAFSLAASGLRSLSKGSLIPSIAVHLAADLYLFAITG